MSKAQRNNQARREYMLTIPDRLLKGFVGIFFGLVVSIAIPLLVAILAYEENKWPWNFEP